MASHNHILCKKSTEKKDDFKKHFMGAFCFAITVLDQKQRKRKGFITKFGYLFRLIDIYGWVNNWHHVSSAKTKIRYHKIFSALSPSELFSCTLVCSLVTIEIMINTMVGVDTILDQYCSIEIPILTFLDVSG